MNDTLALVLAGLFSGGSFAAIFKLIDSWLSHRRARKDKQEDRELDKKDRTQALTEAFETFKTSENERNERQEAHFKKIDDKLTAIIEGDRLMMLDRIIFLGTKYIERGEITFEERHKLREMHNSYHFGLGGNGDADLIMEAVDELPLKK